MARARRSAIRSKRKRCRRPTAEALTRWRGLCWSARSSRISAIPSTAAGVAGVIKIVESMRTGVCPRRCISIHPHRKWIGPPARRGGRSRTSLARPDRPTAACRGVVVRPQRNKCPRDTRAGVAEFASCEIDSKRVRRHAVGGVCEVGIRIGRAGSPVAAVRRAAHRRGSNDVAYSLVTTRASFDYRAVVVGADT